MSIWEEHHAQAAILEALEDVTIVNEAGHHFGRPFVTAYQLALKVDRAHPEIAQALGVEVGGSGTGRHTLARYLANELSKRIHRDGESFPVEGAFMSNDDVKALVYIKPNGGELHSSLTGTGFDLSLYRRR